MSFLFNVLLICFNKRMILCLCLKYLWTELHLELPRQHFYSCHIYCYSRHITGYEVHNFLFMSCTSRTSNVLPFDNWSWLCMASEVYKITQKHTLGAMHTSYQGSIMVIMWMMITPEKWCFLEYMRSAVTQNYHAEKLYKPFAVSPRTRLWFIVIHLCVQTLGPLLLTWINYNLGMDVKLHPLIHCKMWNEITYPSLNSKGAK